MQQNLPKRPVHFIFDNPVGRWLISGVVIIAVSISVIGGVDDVVASSNQSVRDAPQSRVLNQQISLEKPRMLIADVQSAKSIINPPMTALSGKPGNPKMPQTSDYKATQLTIVGSVLLAITALIGGLIFKKRKD